MSRRKKAGRGGPRDAKPTEVLPDWRAEMPPASPPRPRKGLLIVTGVLLGAWIVFLAVMASCTLAASRGAWDNRPFAVASPTAVARLSVRQSRRFRPAFPTRGVAKP